MNIIEIGLSFVEGVALIASPCILPVLPLVLSSSIDGGKQRPYGIIFGFILSFTFFALVSRQLVLIFHLNLDYIKYGSLILLAMFGIVMISTYLTNKFASLSGNLARFGVTNSKLNNGGFFSGTIIGALIGFVWTPCAGPILAAVLVQVIRQQSNLNALFIVLSFALGAGIPMLLIAILGRKFMANFGFIKKHAEKIRKAFGIAMLGAVLFIASGFDAQSIFASTSVLNNSSNTVNNKELQNGLDIPYQAPEIAVSNSWLNTANSKSLSIKSLYGKVVLIDFWTYSCINCIRTLPSLTKIYAKYHSKGLEIIGVHSPEFEFEKNQQNVINSISRFGIKYPVAMDNNLDTWTNFNNQYWPAHYLIDKSGRVVYTYFGEGDDQILEHNIKVLLGDGDQNSVIEDAANQRLSREQTPETYLGSARAQAFANADSTVLNQVSNYSFPAFLPSDNWALSGGWIINPQKITAQSNQSKLQINFTAKHVYLVLGSASGKAIKATLKLNGKPITNKLSGVDVRNGAVIVNGYRLYELVNQSVAANGLLELDVQSSGLEAYAFTFG